MRLVEPIRTTGLCIALCAGVAWGVAHGSPADTLKSCAANAKLPARGLDALAAQCPDLEAALKTLGFTQTLQAGWQKQLTPAKLAELATLAGRYQRETPSRPPDLGALHGILDGLAQERARVPKSWWEIFKDWLESWISRSGDHDLSWLERWMDRLSTVSGAVTALAWALVGAVLLGAAVFIGRELKAAGLFSSTKERSAGAPAGAASSRAESDLEIALDQRSLFEQPALLLALLVQSLKRGGRLAAERHLTHRELVRRAVLDDSLQRDRLGRIAAIAEEVLYGSQAPAEPRMQSAIQEGRELLRQLGGPRGTA